ncbi:MAG: RidA family protein [Candidatus Melainabacteria bacterium]
MTPTAPAELAERLKALDAVLPPAPQPVGNYVPVVQAGSLVMTSGMIPLKEGKIAQEGALGASGVSVEAGQAAARVCVLNALSALKAHLGSLEKIQRIVKLTGYVSSQPDFYQQPAVINGASDTLVEYFGERGKHARAAVGVAALPMNASVEVDLVVEVG